jgi:hypothetical protein
VRKEGDPLKIVVLKGLSCGLSQSAMAAVAGWKLKPATTADGTPMAVWQQIEVTFQLY